MKKCPVCHSPLSDSQFEKALGIMEEKQKALKDAQAKALKVAEDLKQQLKQSKEKVKQARAAGVEAERAKTKRMLQGKDRDIETLKQRIRQLQKGTTPQSEGLEFEEILVKRLRREFPCDLIEHKGKGGDILHTVMFEEKKAGVVIYECKRTPTVQGQHVEQTLLAKKQREADFGILITTGKKKGFTGFALMNSVLVVSPFAVIPLATLVRNHLVEMMRAKISQEERAVLAARLLDFIASPQFKNPIDEVVRVASDLEQMVKDEANDHLRIWTKRLHNYQTIRWDTTQVRENIQLVLHGGNPKSLPRPKDSPLQLLAENTD